MQLPVWASPVKRQSGWERGYTATLERHLAAPFAWGVSDCLIVPADLSEAMCGRNPLPMKMRTYRTEIGALKLMRKLGFANVEEALTAVFPSIAMARARRGDCGVVEQRLDDGTIRLATMIVLGDGSAIGKGATGIARMPISRLRSLFAIGAV